MFISFQSWQKNRREGDSVITGTMHHGKPKRKNRKLPLKIMVFILAAALLPLDWSMAAASGLLRDVVSDYAYTKGNYGGIDQAAKSVFYVEMYDSKLQMMGSGSGFIMFEERLLVTNQHVIDGAAYIGLLDDDGRQYTVDRVVVSDKEHDIAILYFPEGKNYNPLNYDTTFDDLVRGQPVLAIGSPKGMPGTVSDGIISAFPLFKGEDTRYIQTTAPISHGSSGGCLLNENLKVIGVTSAGIDEGQNIGFAIPIYIVEKLYQQWDKKTVQQLGTAASWDTVGAGLHRKISGKREKSQPEFGRATVTAAPRARNPETAPPARNPETATPANSPNSSGKGLGVTWDTTKPIRPGYSLLLDGKKLDWNNTFDSAVRTLKEYGFEVHPVSESQANLDKEDVFFCNSIPVNFVQVMKNAKNDGLNSISIIMKTEHSLEDIAARIEDVDQKLQTYLGSVRRTIKCYLNDKSVDVSDLGIKGAIEKAVSSGSDSPSVAISYNDSLMVYISPRNWDGNLIFDSEISLASWY